MTMTKTAQEVARAHAALDERGAPRGDEADPFSLEQRIYALPCSVREAGRKGGAKAAERGHEFFVKIGRKGGARVKAAFAALAAAKRAR